MKGENTMKEKIAKIEKRFRRIKRVLIFLICIIVVRIFIITILCFEYENLFKDEMQRISMLCIVSIIVIKMLCFLYINIDSITEQEIENQKLIKSLPEEYGLSQEAFIEVEVYPRTKKLKKEVRFYARLHTQEEIELLKLDKDGNELEKEFISDFVYFKENYKRKA